MFNTETNVQHPHSRLEKAIDDLMRYLLATWPTVSIPLKLHMLEDHALEFIRECGIGFGLYGEQGGESIHAEFNSLYRTYRGMKPNRLRV